MVANLTRYKVCTVHPDSSDRPIPERKSTHYVEAAERSMVPNRKDQTGDEPVRLFVWVSA
ncbi:MAG TPA: hypothetical protein VF463_21030 [Sphingobium sp.]